MSEPPPAPPASIAFVLKGYPRLSETFITQEILALEARGLRLHLVSLRHPTEASVHPVHARVRAPVTYLPEYLHREPVRVLRAWRQVRRWPRYRAALRLWLRDLARDPTRNRVRRFGQAVVMAHELPREVTHIHAHFLHTPASVARYAAHLTGRKWTGSAHAKDIWTTSRREKREKLHDAEWVVTCTAVNRAELDALAPGRVELVRHGLDLEEFPPPPRLADPARAPLTILSVGRAVEKKGYPDLVAALARLPETPAWRFVHVGGGPLVAALRGLAERAGIADRTEWAGALARPELLARLRAADVFVLASRIARDGDRDGLPNVLLEAQSQGLACVATRVSRDPRAHRGRGDGDPRAAGRPGRPRRRALPPSPRPRPAAPARGRGGALRAHRVLFGRRRRSAGREVPRAARSGDGRPNRARSARRGRLDSGPGGGSKLHRGGKGGMRKGLDSLEVPSS